MVTTIKDFFAERGVRVDLSLYKRKKIEEKKEKTNLYCSQTWRSGRKSCFQANSMEKGKSAVFSEISKMKYFLEYLGWFCRSHNRIRPASASQWPSESFLATVDLVLLSYWAVLGIHRLTAAARLPMQYSMPTKRKLCSLSGLIVPPRKTLLS